MPHISVKLWPGRNDELKQKLADELANCMKKTLVVDLEDISVSILEVERELWGENVYWPEIIEGKGRLFKEPGYHYKKSN